MCLTINKEATEQMKRDVHGEVNVFKHVLCLEGNPNELRSPVIPYIWVSGIHRPAERACDSWTHQDAEEFVCGGAFHVFLDYSQCEYNCQCNEDGHFHGVLPMKAHMDDLIAVSGKGDAAFRAVHVTHEDLAQVKQQAMTHFSEAKSNGGVAEVTSAATTGTSFYGPTLIAPYPLWKYAQATSAITLISGTKP